MLEDIIDGFYEMHYEMFRNQFPSFEEFIDWYNNRPH